jgi:calcineurin-like phosphoesterase
MQKKSGKLTKQVEILKKKGIDILVVGQHKWFIKDPVGSS